MNIHGRTSQAARLAGVALIGAMALAACGTDNNGAPAAGNGPKTNANCPSGSVTGAGSSFQDPMEQQWASDYLAACPGVRVNYNSVGSGAGIQQFGQGTIDFAGSDVVMTAEEQQAANTRCGGSTAVHLPVTAGGVAVTYHLAGVTGLRLSPDVLAGIFQGTITRWNAPAIKADNPGVTLPGAPIVVFHRSDGSGTTAVFTSYLAAAAPGGWKLGSGKTVNWPVGQGGKGNEGVSAGVDQTVGGVTYTEEAFAQQHKLATALIRNAGDSYVELTAGHVSTALRSARVVGQGRDASVEINYKPTGSDAYPISTVSYAIVCGTYPKSVSQDTLAVLRGFLTHAITDGQQAATRMGFAPIPQSLVDKDRTAIAAISTS